MLRRATVRVPGSCGELVQGVLNHQGFLISCPINLYSKVTVTLDKGFSGYSSNIKADKTILAVKKSLYYLNCSNYGAKIYIQSQLLRGKGMASSTADIAAAVGAVLTALRYEIDYNFIKKIALEIEPSDSVFLPGIFLFNHHKGNIMEYLGEPPLVDILIFSEAGEIDTISFNQRKELTGLNNKKESMVREAVNLIREGIITNNLKLIGYGVTLSSQAHQSILYKASLNKVIDLTENVEGLYGVNVAHSGTLIGLLIDSNLSASRLIEIVRKNIPELLFLTRARLISGGLEIIKGD